MPLDRCGARVASRQSPILRNGTSSLTMMCISGKSQKGLSRPDMMKDLEWASETQALSRPMVQHTNVRSQLVIRHYCQVRTLGQVLTQQAVGILIGTSFPGMIRMGKEDLQAQLAFEFGRTSKFTSIVQREAVAFRVGKSAYRLPEMPADKFCGACLDCLRL